MKSPVLLFLLIIVRGFCDANLRFLISSINFIEVYENSFNFLIKTGISFDFVSVYTKDQRRRGDNYFMNYRML